MTTKGRLPRRGEQNSIPTGSQVLALNFYRKEQNQKGRPLAALRFVLDL